MHNRFMQKAIDIAYKYQFLTYPNPAVGACIVYNNKMISIQAHKQAGQPHAEVDAIKSAFLLHNPNSTLKELTKSSDIHNYLLKNHNNYFCDKTIYITLEPCNHIGKTPSCANLLKELKFKKIFIGTLDTNDEAKGGIDTLKRYDLDFEVGLLEEKCKDLLIPFTLWQKDKFRFFKLAIREDGSYKDGYITTQDSLNLVHNIRTKLDLLIVGGNTTRVDRPKLDSRFSKTKKSPNIMIYSRQKDFDKTIPLFNIKNRDVVISDNLNSINYNFCMVEGGFNLLQKIKDDIDMLVLFISHKEKFQNKFNINNLKFTIIHSYFLNQYDEIIFLKNRY